MFKKLLIISIPVTVILAAIVIGWNINYLKVNWLTNSAPWYTPLLYPGIKYYIAILIEVILLIIVVKKKK